MSNGYIKKKHISIIIPAYNEEENITRCLQSIKKLITPKNDYEVIVVDNGSTDKTCDLAQRFDGYLNLQVHVVPDVNVSTVRNIGVKHSTGEILAFVDADCTVNHAWLTNAIKHFIDPGIGAVGCSVEVPQNSSWVAKTWDLNNARKRQLGEVSFLPTGNLIVPRKMFVEIGGFDDGLSSNEDFDFCFRLRKQGYRIYADPSIQVVHWGVPKNLLDFYNRERWHGTHVFKVFLKNIIEMKNFKAVSYALYYVILIFLLIVALFYAIATSSYELFYIFIGAGISPPIILAIKTIISQRLAPNLIPAMSLIYLIYGLARASSIIDFRNWFFQRIK